MLHKGRNNGSHKHSTSNNITTTIDKSTFLSWAVVRSVTGIRYSYASSGVKKRPFGDKPSRRWFVSNASTCVVVLYVWPESVPITYDSSSSMRFWVSWHKYDAIIFKQFQLSTFNNNNNNTIECTYCRQKNGRTWVRYPVQWTDCRLRWLWTRRTPAFAKFAAARPFACLWSVFKREEQQLLTKKKHTHTHIHKRNTKHVP